MNPLRMTRLLMVGVVIASAIGGCQQEVQTVSQPLGYSDPHPPVDEFSSAVNRPPTAKTLYAMGRILAAQGKSEEATAILRRTTTTYPDYMPAYVELAELHMRQGQVDHAIAVLEQARKVSPRDPVLLNDLGMCRLLKGDYGGALEMISQAAELAPDDARYHANRGVALGMMGRDQEALDAFKTVMPAGDAHYNLAVLLAARQQRERADQEFRTAEAMGFKPPPAGPRLSSREEPAK